MHECSKQHHYERRYTKRDYTSTVTEADGLPLIKCNVKSRMFIAQQAPKFWKHRFDGQRNTDRISARIKIICVVVHIIHIIIQLEH